MNKGLLLAALVIPYTTLFAFGGNFDDVNPVNQNQHLNYGIREEILQQKVWNNTLYINDQKINPYNGQPREYRPNPLIIHDGLGYF